MARGGNQQAQSAATTAQNNSNELTGNARGVFNTLIPSLTSEVSNPTGYGAPTLAKMNTSAQQSAGGSMAGAVGQGGLLAARTRNAGGADAAVAQSARNAGQQLSQNALDTDVADAQLKENQRQSGLKALQGIYGVDVGGANDALGNVGSAINADTNARNVTPTWIKALGALSGAAQAGATAYAGRK